MKRFLFILLAISLLLSLSLVCFADEGAQTEALADEGEAEFIDEGRSLIEEWGAVLMDFIAVIREYTPDDWKAVIDEQVVPWVTLAVSSILSVYIAISPVLYKIKKTSDRFNNSSDKLEKSQEVAEKAKKQLKEAQNDVQSLKAEFAEVKEGYKQMISSVSNIEKIVRLGFGNSDELIVKGYAHEIAKVGSENEKNEENKKA